jgi:hypothetical protein
MSEGEEGRAGSRRNSERLLRRIRQTRSTTGHPLRCSECNRLSSGRATGWTIRLGDDNRLCTFCPECDEFEFG